MWLFIRQAIMQRKEDCVTQRFVDTRGVRGEIAAFCDFL